MGNSNQSKVVQSIIITQNRNQLNKSFDSIDKNIKSTRDQIINLNISNQISYQNDNQNKKTKNTQKPKKQRIKTILQTDPNNQLRQIMRAKKKYEKVKSQNQEKINQIKLKKIKLNIIYGEHNQTSNQQNIAQFDHLQDEVKIWGNKLNININDPEYLYQQNKYPKDSILSDQQSQKYSNWDIYRKKIIKQQFAKLQQQQKSITEQENWLKEDYESLLKQKNNKNKKKNKNYKNQLYIMQQNNVCQGQTCEICIQNMITPSFKKQNKSQWNSDIKFDNDDEDQEYSQSQQNQAQKNDNRILKLLTQQELQNVYFLARQIFYYQIYLWKRRVIYISNDSPQRSYYINKYPSHRYFTYRPDRTKQTIKDTYRIYKENMSEERRNKKKSKPKTKNQQILSNSMYKKVYQRIRLPDEKKEKSELYYYSKPAEQKQIEPQTNYPFQKPNDNQIFPNIVWVQNNFINQQSSMPDFHLQVKELPKNVFKDFLEKSNSNQLGLDNENILTQQQKQEKNYRKNQRNLQDKILKKIKDKYL